jgi:hypothetical protein
MNKDPSDFMIQEYEQTNLGFFHLLDKVNDWFKTFVALYGIPFTVLAAVIGVGDGISRLDLFEMPAIVAFLLAVIALLGFFVAMMIVSMRMEMILYKRTVNDVRRFFGEIETGYSAISSIAPYLVLPTSDRKPPFYEPYRDIFWQILFIGFMDSFTLYISMANLLSLNLVVLTMIALLYWGLHWLGYWATARRRDMKWQTLHPTDLQTANY